MTEVGEEYYLLHRGVSVLVDRLEYRVGQAMRLDQGEIVAHLTEALGQVRLAEERARDLLPKFPSR